MAKPRIAWFTPLQPVESGISLYSEDILPILANVVDIDVVVDNYDPTKLRESASLSICPYRSFDSERYDLVVYQLGNSPVHLYMLPEIERTPGLLVLHDTMLNHLFIQRAAREGTLLDYRLEMQRRYGADGARAADRVLKGQAPDDLFRFPMSEPLIYRSLATIVHSEFARSQASGWASDSTVVRVPHGLHLPEYVEKSVARQFLRVPSDQFLIASISHINPHKRIDVVLRALRRLRQAVPSRAILAGSVSRNFPLQRIVNHLSLDQVVDLPGYVSDQQALLIAAAADVIVNLRYPTAGETSGSLLHSMAAGRPVLVSRTGSFTEIPDDAVIRVPVDTLEEDMLVAVFQRLATDPSFGDSIGSRARAFIMEEHSLERWVNGYVDIFEELTGHSIERPTVSDREEVFVDHQSDPEAQDRDELIDSIATDVAELGLGGDDELLADIAKSQMELGLGVGMINVKSRT
jgi:glycosyltransferase involved in cell wall biosynthesis